MSFCRVLPAANARVVWLTPVFHRSLCDVLVN